MLGCVCYDGKIVLICIDRHIMAEGVIRITDEFDPERCVGIRIGSQCNFKRRPGREMCPVCDKHFYKQDRKEKTDVYLLTKWRDRLSRLTTDDGIKSLRDEIGIVRMTLESLLNLCSKDEDLVLNSTKICELVGKCEHLVVACQKLEKTTGMMMDKTTALQIASNIVTIISEFVTDVEVIDKISSAIIDRVLNIEYRPDL